MKRHRSPLENIRTEKLNDAFDARRLVYSRCPTGLKIRRRAERPRELRHRSAGNSDAGGPPNIVNTGNGTRTDDFVNNRTRIYRARHRTTIFPRLPDRILFRTIRLIHRSGRGRFIHGNAWIQRAKWKSRAPFTRKRAASSYRFISRSRRSEWKLTCEGEQDRFARRSRVKDR